MSSTTIPTYVGNADGNVDASASLAASASRNANVDYSAVFEGQIHVKNTPGGSVAATRGLRIDVFRRYGSSPTTSPTPCYTKTLPSQTASTAEGDDIFLSTGKYNIKVTNLDATNAVTVEITGDTVSNLATT
jgi:hypothetical protein